jgi:hypothetical protein
LGPLAILAFAAHRNGNDIDHDECDMLAQFAARAARGYERMAFNFLSKEVADLQARLAAVQGVG